MPADYKARWVSKRYLDVKRMADIEGVELALETACQVRDTQLMQGVSTLRVGMLIRRCMSKLNELRGEA